MFSHFAPYPPGQPIRLPSISSLVIFDARAVPLGVIGLARAVIVGEAVTLGHDGLKLCPRKILVARSPRLAGSIPSFSLPQSHIPVAAATRATASLESTSCLSLSASNHSNLCCYAWRPRSSLMLLPPSISVSHQPRKSAVAVYSALSAKARPISCLRGPWVLLSAVLASGCGPNPPIALATEAPTTEASAPVIHAHCFACTPATRLLHRDKPLPCYCTHFLYQIYTVQAMLCSLYGH